MKQTRFDTRLIQILSAMAALAIMVGVAAIGVNRYLVGSHQALISNNIPAIELASQIGARAEVIGSLAATFMQAETGADLDRIAAALGKAVADIEGGATRLKTINPAAAALVVPSKAGEIAARMTEKAHSALHLSDQIKAQAEELAQTGARLDTLLEAETDLARLRITAGIAGLYTAPLTDPRQILDALADRAFFAFERLTEMGRTVDGLRLQMQQVPGITRLDDIDFARENIGERLALAQRRLVFLPSALAQQEVSGLLARLQQTIDAAGLLDLQRDKIAMQAAIAVDQERLQNAISTLSDSARDARAAVQAYGFGQIAAAERRSSQMTMTLLLIVAMAVALGAALWLYARRQLVARLGTLSRRIIAVAGGDYAAPLSITGHDELGRMEKALNILRRRAIEGERLRDNLQEAVIARTGDVVAEMRASDSARDEAEAANHSKTEFLARMSHEIRTPLNGLIGMLALLEVEVTDPSGRARVKTARDSAAALLDITNDILNFAGAEDRANRGNPVHFNLRDLVGQLGHHMQPLAAAKGLEVGIDLAESAPLVLFGDVVKLRQIVGNLISNAVKYTKRGRVMLSVDHAFDDISGQPVISFAVTDTGIGMSQQMIARAFDAYSRTEEVRRSGVEGLGLGLAISRKLTEALGGLISVESAPGVGSRFTLTVPLAVGDPALIAEDVALPSTTNLGRTVLVIDDHAVNRMVARGYLERMGCHVVEAETGMAGLAAGGFEVALIDLDLPDMTGQEVAAQLALRPGAPLLVALTAHLIDDTPQNRARLGVARILAKPISPRALAEVLEMPQDALHQSLAGDVTDLGAQTTALILQEFLADLPAALEVIRSAANDQQRKAAHRLKGAASNFRLDALCAVLATIEVEGGDATLIAQLEGEADVGVTRLIATAARLGLQTDAGSTK